MGVSIFCRRIREVACSRFFFGREGGSLPCAFLSLKKLRSFGVKKRKRKRKENLEFVPKFIFYLIWLLFEPPTAAGRRGEAKFLDFSFGSSLNFG